MNMTDKPIQFHEKLRESEENNAVLQTQKVFALGVQYVAVRPPPGLPLCGLNTAASL